MMAVDGTAETSGFAEKFDYGQTAREAILTTNYYFVADNVVHIKIIPSPFNYNFHL